MRSYRSFRLVAALALGGLCAAPGGAAASPDSGASQHLAVHEWGTFTALQDEQGRPIGGINTDDEPVPSFCHDIHQMLVQSPSEMPPVYFKGWPRCDRDVLVRLETPIIYFHPAPGSGPMKLDVRVAFNGGWLTQFYPDAKASAPGLESEHFDSGPLTSQTTGHLEWHGLTVGTAGQGPQTDDKVWTAPRNVDAANVTTDTRESERFLFYRGIGHLNAPLQVSRSADGKQLIVKADWHIWMHETDTLKLGPLWLLDVRADGTSALRTIDQIAIAPGAPDRAASAVASSFAESDYGKGTIPAIRKALHEALVRSGLFDDEAEGLLNTWEASYFRRPGMRLLFMVPPIWTQQVLPLSISRSADLTRVMVGRIELVTPHERELLRQIAGGPASKPDWLPRVLEALKGQREGLYREDTYTALESGRLSIQRANVHIPHDYRAYLALGRFRNALVLDEQERHPTAALGDFIRNYQLAASRTH